jgi:hypothetical protein
VPSRWTRIVNGEVGPGELDADAGQRPVVSVRELGGEGPSSRADQQLTRRNRTGKAHLRREGRIEAVGVVVTDQLVKGRTVGGEVKVEVHRVIECRGGRPARAALSAVLERSVGSSPTSTA